MTMKLYSKTFKAMGSIGEIKLYHEDEREFDKIYGLLQNELKRLENKYTRFKANSVTSKINQSAGTGEAIQIDEETSKLLNYAQILYEQSDGLFDITSGTLRKIWDFRSNKLPNDQQINEATKFIGWDKIELNPDKIYLPKKNMEIDFGGFVKEYTVDVLATMLTSNGASNGLVNLGGDMKIIGPHADGKPWRVGLQHPRISNKAILTLDISRGAIATSGDYERFMMIDGRRYSHLLNPFSGESITPHYAAVSVILEQCLIAGSFSTLAMLKSEKEPNWIRDLGVDYIAVDQDMKILKRHSRSPETC